MQYMQYLDVEVAQLDCINLHGLKLGLNGKEDRLTDKLLSYQNSTLQPNHGTKIIELRVNPLDDSRFLILEGHHRSFSHYVHNKSISSVVYDSDKEIKDPLPRENFDRSLRYHQSASLLGVGTVQDLMDENAFNKYVEYLQALRSRNGNIAKVIAALETFWSRRKI